MILPSLRKKHFQRQKQRDMTNRAATVVTEIRIVRAVPTTREKNKELISSFVIFHIYIIYNLSFLLLQKPDLKS